MINDYDKYAYLLLWQYIHRKLRSVQTLCTTSCYYQCNLWLWKIPIFALQLFLHLALQKNWNRGNEHTICESAVQRYIFVFTDNNYHLIADCKMHGTNLILNYHSLYCYAVLIVSFNCFMSTWVLWDGVCLPTWVAGHYVKRLEGIEEV